MIQLFRPGFEVDECLNEIKECLEKGWTGDGYKTVQFEEQWKREMGFQNALFLNSATAGLYLAVRVLGEKCEWSSEAEIITTPLTFVSTNHAVLKNGYKCIFADVDDTFCLSEESVLERITHNTKAIIYVGYGGCTANLSKIVETCKEKRIKLIVDAAHMAGKNVTNSNLTRDSDAVVYSFHAVKNLPTGDAGMLCMKEDELAEKARCLSWLGIDKTTYSRTSKKRYSWQYTVEYLGDKFNGNSIMASIALVQLKYLERNNLKRKEIANLYLEELKPIIEKGYIKTQRIPSVCKTNYHLFSVLVEGRDDVINYLSDKGIQTGVHYQCTTSFPMYNYAAGTCPYAEWVSKHELSLPMHVYLSENDIILIVKSLKEFLDIPLTCPQLITKG